MLREEDSRKALPDKTEWKLQQKTQRWRSWCNGDQVTPRTRQASAPGTHKESEAQHMQLNLKWSKRENGGEASESKTLKVLDHTHYKNKKIPENMLKDQGDGTHHNKTPTKSGERHQLSKMANNRVITARCSWDSVNK